ncbi:MAG: hypothetical protein M5U15_09925 [Kiritimatiellae bacterium]|nr:hypothetical protein [Kiritimatiellia bacterium]
MERPDFGGAQTSSIEYEYNTKGQLIRLVNPHRADTLFEYDELGNQMASGLDLNNNTVLNRDGIDRVSETETIYEVDGSNVFRVSISKIYPDDDSGIPLTNSIQKAVFWDGQNNWLKTNMPSTFMVKRQEPIELLFVPINRKLSL